MGADLWFYRMPPDKEIAYFRNYAPLNVAVGVIRDLRYPEGDARRANPYDVKVEILPQDMEILAKMAAFARKFPDVRENQFVEYHRLMREIKDAFAAGDRVFAFLSM